MVCTDPPVTKQQQREEEAKGQPTSQETTQPKRKKRIVILGSGWAAVSILRELDQTAYEVSEHPARLPCPVLYSACARLTYPAEQVVVVSPRNYFLFTPLLPSVTVGTLDPRRCLKAFAVFVSAPHQY